MDPLLHGLILVVVTGLSLIGYLVIHGRQSSTRDVMGRVREIHDVGTQAQALPPSEVAGQRVTMPTVEKYIAGAGFTIRLMDTLTRAGWKLKPSEYVGMTIGAISVGAIIATILLQNPLGGLVGGVVGYGIPKLMLSMSVGRRQNALEAQIPDTVLLISSALKSGYSFLKALQVVAKEMPPPMGDVSRRVVEECQLGVPMEDALVRMAERVRSYDLNLVVTAVVIQSQVGGSLAEVLDSIAVTIRERIQIEAEVSALTAEGRISGIVLVLMAPAMAVALSVINPSYIGVLISDPMGIKMIVGTVVLQILGIVVIKRMMKIEV